MKWWIGSLVLLLAGMVFKLSLLVYAMYVLIGMLLISRYLSRTWINSIVSSRSCSEDVVEIGETVTVEVTIANRGLLSISWILCEDFLAREALVRNPPSLEVKGPRLALISLARDGEKTLSYTLKCQRRGYFQIGPLLLETGDVFGLHRRFRIASDPSYLMVLPRVVLLRNYDLASPRPLGEIRVSHRLFEDPTLIAGVKPYEDGQPLNRIHWRATARTGVLQSKVFQPSTIAGVTILLDFHSAHYQGQGGPFREELAITTAASIANALFQMGQRFGLLTNGRDAAARIKEEGWQRTFQDRGKAQNEATKEDRHQRLQPLALPPSRGEAHYQTLLENLARLELNDGFSMAELVRTFSNFLARNTTIVAIVSSIDLEIATSLGALKNRGFQVAAIVIAFDEPALSDWAEAPEWVRLLLAQGIKFHRVDNDDALAEFCTAILSHV
jgi:uncharacterized protein (DUF58 family)